jgi:hypothetical protein
MSVPPPAHAGHWLGQLAYLAPLLILVGIALASKLRNRRAGEAAERAQAAPEDER